MKVIFRGGPKDRQRAEVNGFPNALEIVKPSSLTFDLRDIDGPPQYTGTTVRGRYSRTMDSTKKGIYYMVWMGWDE